MSRKDGRQVLARENRQYYFLRLTVLMILYCTVIQYITCNGMDPKKIETLACGQVGRTMTVGVAIVRPRTGNGNE